MRNYIKKLLLSSLVALFGFTGLATTASASTDTTVKERSVEIQSIPERYYV